MGKRHPSEHKRRRQDNHRHRPSGATNAICGLVGYQERKGADRAAKRLPPIDGEHARAYQCIDGCDLWHAGWLPGLVRAGVVTATEWYGRDGQPPMQDILLPLLERLRAIGRGKATFERRQHGPDDTDLWTAVIDCRAGMFVARDYDTPHAAAMAVIADYADATDQEFSAA
jgi:hypothetical protein